MQKPEARQHSDFFAPYAENLESKHYRYFTEGKTMVQKSYDLSKLFRNSEYSNIGNLTLRADMIALF